MTPFSTNSVVNAARLIDCASKHLTRPVDGIRIIIGRTDIDRIGPGLTR